MTEAKKVRDLKLDRKNANKGTRRGRRRSTRASGELGAGRSVLLDREGRDLAGNKTVEAARGAGIDDVIVVQTDGRQLVAVQRTDLDLEERRHARAGWRMPTTARRAGSRWDGDQIEPDLAEGIELGDLFTE